MSNPSNDDKPVIPQNGQVPQGPVQFVTPPPQPEGEYIDVVIPLDEATSINSRQRDQSKESEPSSGD